MGCILMSPSSSTFIHVVGGSFGWGIPDNTTFYQDWAKPRTFGVGDKLGRVAVFLYRTGVHDVLEVSQKDFKACTQNNVTAMHFAGPTILELTEPGDHYYYCGVGAHCCIVVAMRLAGYHGKKYKVVEEVLAFVNIVEVHDVDHFVSPENLFE
ncbi:PREDICTED: mavicyanin-like [Nelumbo nucifera]|uniref:Mavicyanin-like n=1 Tax=Nelumbo nucifera TaxID=4432 RepID=A0A1U8AHT9_NELNU|nr:PREDICTED: mavicyanin-like [Nelumbo nucifera]